MSTGRKMLLGLVAFAALPFLLFAWFWFSIEPGLQAESLPSRAAGAPPPGHAEAVSLGRQLARSLMEEQNLPGLSVAVAVGGRIVWAEGFGFADYEAERPVTPTTRFRIGSVTKTINAAAAGLLHERGRLDLDAPVQQYVPGYPVKRWPIATRQLLAHSAGLRHHRGEGDILRSFACETDPERLAVFADDPLLFEPGTEVLYSTYGHVLAGAAIAAAAGEPWLEFVKREVFDPLGMQHTAADSLDRTGPDDARTYFPRLALNPRWGLQTLDYVDLTCTLAANGLVSTPADLVRFGSALLDAGFLAPESVELLFTPVRLPSGETTGSALGWVVQEMRLGDDPDPVRVVGHSGNEPGGTASLLLVPDHGIVVAVTSNVGWTADRGFFAVMSGDQPHVPFGPVADLAIRLAGAFARPIEQ